MYLPVGRQAKYFFIQHSALDIRYLKKVQSNKYHVPSILWMHIVIEMRIMLSDISTSILLAENRTLYFVLGTLYNS